jgi:hypothetical protein
MSDFEAGEARREQYADAIREAFDERVLDCWPDMEREADAIIALADAEITALARKAARRILEERRAVQRLSGQLTVAWDTAETRRKAYVAERTAHNALRDENNAMRALIEQSNPNYQYQVFDTNRSRKVMDVLDGDLPNVQADMAKYTPDGWVIRRRVVGPWEEI